MHSSGDSSLFMRICWRKINKQDYTHVATHAWFELGTLTLQGQQSTPMPCHTLRNYDMLSRPIILVVQCQISVPLRNEKNMSCYNDVLEIVCVLDSLIAR